MWTSPPLHLCYVCWWLTQRHTRPKNKLVVKEETVSLVVVCGSNSECYTLTTCLHCICSDVYIYICVCERDGGRFGIDRMEDCNFDGFMTYKSLTFIGNQQWWVCLYTTTDMAALMHREQRVRVVSPDRGSCYRAVNRNQPLAKCHQLFLFIYGLKRWKKKTTERTQKHN